MKSVVVLLILTGIALADFNIPLCNKTSAHFHPIKGVSKSATYPESVATINYFVYAQNGSQASPSTVVKLCHDTKYLYVNATMVDSDIVSTLFGCNAPLFNQDVFEIFIATTKSYPYQYYEIELSPQNQLFFADIKNPQLTCANLGTQYQECQKLQYGAQITNFGWEGWLKLNLTTIGRGSIPKELMVNMFRIDKNRGQTTKYQCWKSTMANPACFHKPAAFEKIVLQ